MQTARRPTPPPPPRTPSGEDAASAPWDSGAWTTAAEVAVEVEAVREARDLYAYAIGGHGDPEKQRLLDYYGSHHPKGTMAAVMERMQRAERALADAVLQQLGVAVDDVELGDVVWEDRDLDGHQDLAEPPVPGVRLVLRQPGPDAVWDSADDLARACVAALGRGASGRVYHASDDTELKMGDYFDLAADLCGLPRPPRVSRADAALPTELNPDRKSVV